MLGHPTLYPWNTPPDPNPQPPHARHPPPPPPPPMAVTPTEFEDYVLCKALDVISGDGSYKRFVYQCAENEEGWAVRLHASVSKVSQVGWRPQC